MISDEDLPQRSGKASKPAVVGEDLSGFSETDLAARITELEAEIERTKTILAERTNIRSAADALFKPIGS